MMDQNKTFKVYLSGKCVSTEAEAVSILKKARLGLSTRVFRNSAYNEILTFIPEFGLEDLEIEYLSMIHMKQPEWANAFIQMLINRYNVIECLDTLCNLHSPKYGLESYQRNIVEVFNTIPNVSVGEAITVKDNDILHENNTKQANPNKLDAKNLKTLDSEFIVGNSPSTISEVCDVLSKCTGTSDLWSKLQDVAKGLNFPDGEIRMIPMWTHDGIRTNDSILYEILQEWRSLHSSNAKLSTLIDVLQNQNLDKCADALRHRFGG